jgi:heme A synthase
VLTVLLALPLLFFGADITTKGAGMVDAAWPTPPWFLFFLEEAAWEKGKAFEIEHWHRLAGWTVGAAVLLLALAMWRWEARPWVRWLGAAVLVGVGIQGLLGGFRVLLHGLFGPHLALIHGCFGQIVFALLVSLALCTSRRWREGVLQCQPGDTTVFKRWSLIVTVLLVVQLVLGAFYRHQGSLLGLRGHLLIAFAALASMIWVAKTVWERHAEARNLTWGVRMLLGLVVVQLLLGVEAWMVRQAPPVMIEAGHWLLNRDLVRTTHVLGGALLLATAVALTLEAHRLAESKRVPEPAAREGSLEEAA